MVKELIKSVLGKGADNADSVPDELPGLVEDAKPAAAPAKNAPPDELPALSPVRTAKPAPTPAKEATRPEPQPIPDKDRTVIEREIEMMHEELNSDPGPTVQPMAKQGQDDFSQIIAKAASGPGPETPVQDAQFSMRSMATRLEDESGSPGYFAHLAKVIKEQGFNESLLSQDMFQRMKEHYDVQEHEEKGVFTGDEKELNAKLLSKLEEMKEVEAKWQVQKQILEEDKKFLLQRENEIKDKIEGLKRISKELKFHQNVPPERYFVLKNKIVIRNVKEMIDILKVIDDATFSHHVNEYKNDFAEWVRFSVRDLRLAEKISGIRGRKGLITAVEDEIKKEEEDSHPVSYFFKAALEQKNAEEKPDGKQDHETKEKAKPAPISLSDHEDKQVIPENYFRLKSGEVIKRIEELPRAMRKISDDEFYHHVNEEKNDFADWVQHVFGDEKLAGYIRPIKNRKELVDFLDIFL